jgi:DNA-binding response OmpR family regulator
MKADILIIEDEKELAELVQLYLEKEGITTHWAAAAEDGLAFFQQKSTDLIILDINLPGMDGFEFLQQIRRNSSVPVIIVSAREADEDVVMGLGMGADEFVSKPFTPKVLAARVRALLRRNTLYGGDERRIYRFGEFELDYFGYNLKNQGELISISAREFEVLRLLVEHAGNVFSLQEIYDRIWGQEFGEVTAVSVYIQRIRKKIEADFHQPEFVKTIHGKGYLFVKERIL